MIYDCVQIGVCAPLLMFIIEDAVRRDNAAPSFWSLTMLILKAIFFTIYEIFDIIIDIVCLYGLYVAGCTLQTSLISGP